MPLLKVFLNGEHSVPSRKRKISHMWLQVERLLRLLKKKERDKSRYNSCACRFLFIFFIPSKKNNQNIKKKGGMALHYKTTKMPDNKKLF